MALTKHGIRANWSLIFERPNRREREGKRKREKKRKRKRRRREEEEDGGAKRYGTTWNSKVLYEFPCLDG